MDLEEEILNEIRAEAKKLKQRYHAYHNALHLEHARKQRRVTNVAGKK